MTVKVDGLDGLLEALQEIPSRATEKNTVKRALKQAAEPMRALAAALAPYRAEDNPMHLRESIIISDKTVANDPDPGAPAGSVTVFFGPDKRLRQHHGIEMEFGTFKDQAQPFMRPAWEARKEESLKLVGYYMWVEIDGSLSRIAAKAGA